MVRGIFVSIHSIAQINDPTMNKIILFLIFYVCLSSQAFSQVYDFEGHRYDTLRIGNQVWLKQNARSKKYSDGKHLDINNYKCPNADCSKVDSFGLLYNFNGLTNGETGRLVKGICPEGYTIPTPQNWHELMLFLDADTTYLWKNAYNNIKYKIIDKTYGGSGETDFSILPAGINVNNIYNGFGVSTNIRLIDSNTHKSVYITFDGGTAGTINVYNLASELINSNSYYQSCRCIKSDFIVDNKNSEINFDYQVYPNPCKESFTIIANSEKSIKYIELISLNGNILKFEPDSQGIYSTNNMPAGIYFIKAWTETSTIYLKLIVL